MRKAIFLDRDGVINRADVRNGKPYPPESIDDLEVLPGVSPALNDLKAAGYLLIVVTNQPDVARGTISQSTVEAIHHRLAATLPIDEFHACFHDNADQCKCRKPEPGFLIEAVRNHELDLRECFMIGDRWRDIEAGRRAGCRTIFIDYGYAEKQPESPDHRVRSLAEAAQIILETCGEPQ